MPGSPRIAVLGAVAATVVAGCGSGDGTIPEQNAETLLSRLEAIDSNVSQQQCEDAQAQADEFSSEVAALPAEVDDEVKRGLQESADQLVNLTSNDCEVETGASGPAGTETTDTTATEPTTETTTTETTTEDTTTEETTTEEPETGEPEQDQDLVPGNQGQGGSGGVGSDGGIGPGASGRGGQ